MQQGSKSDSFQKISKKTKRFDDGIGKRQDNRKFNASKESRRKNQKSYE